MWVRHIGRQEISIDTSAVHWFRKGCVHQVSHPLGCGDTNTGIALKDEFLPTFFKEAPEAAKSKATRTRVSNRIWSCHRILLEAFQQPVHDPLELEQSVVDLLISVVNRPMIQNDWVSQRQNDIVNQTISIINRTYAERCSLADISLEASLSPFYLSRLFREVMGVTIHQHVVSTRLSAAMELLVDTSLPIIDIAVRVGFGGRSQLSRAISSRLGISSRKLRAMIGEGRFRELCSTLSQPPQESSHPTSSK